VRIYACSLGLDPARLVPGEDLVLSVDVAHGTDLPLGVAALDHLDLDGRRQVDVRAHHALVQWRRCYDERLTIEQVCWPFVWEYELFSRVFVPVIGTIMAIQSALRGRRPGSLLWCEQDESVPDLVRLAAAQAGWEVSIAPGGRSRGCSSNRRGARPVRRARQILFAAATSVGLPSRLRAHSVLFSSYWPMMPVLDRMLDDRRWRPAIVATNRPIGVRRSLRAAAQGGWTGRPGPRARHCADAKMSAAVKAVSEMPGPIELDGISVERCLHKRCIEIARRRGTDDLAIGVMLRRALDRTRVHSVLVPYDHEPRSRLLVSIAKQAGIPTIVFQHGAYVIPTELHDMTVADVSAVWSPEIAAPIQFAAPPWVIGYPLTHEPPPPTRTRTGDGSPRAVVMAQSWELGSMLIDPRDVMRHYLTAVGAIRHTLPGALITLRPHPTDDLGPARELCRRFPDLRIDVATDLVTLLRDCDVCIGGPSTGTLQAALVGAPAILLNVTGRDWYWPLGGNTTVPIARSEPELSGWLKSWARGEALPGREDLLAGLGAGGQDSSERLLARLQGLRPQERIRQGDCERAADRSA
jgi:hypothetical protein